MTAPTPHCYEVTITGRLGPVLGRTLAPAGGIRTERCTVIRARTSADRDLAELLRSLDSRGIRAMGVFVVT
jgi:hypothetical protein